MKFDITSQLGLVHRAVVDRERDGKPARAVVASRTYDTDIEDLWDALTRPERIPRWFLPISGELRLGGRYQLQGNAGGEITRCEPPHLLSVTWEFGGDVSWLEVRLSTDPNGGARLELEHTAHINELWGKFGPGAVGVGWDLTLFGLGLHLATGADNDPQAFMAWTMSDEGKQFMRSCSAAWGRADIVAGADEADATASAGRTAAFYCGEDPTS